MRLSIVVVRYKVCVVYLCLGVACGSNQFECMDGSCIQLSQRCDDVAHCYNGEDEPNCTSAGE